MVYQIQLILIASQRVYTFAIWIETARLFSIEECWNELWTVYYNAYFLTASLTSCFQTFNTAFRQFLHWIHQKSIWNPIRFFYLKSNVIYKTNTFFLIGYKERQNHTGNQPHPPKKPHLSPTTDGQWLWIPPLYSFVMPLYIDFAFYIVDHAVVTPFVTYFVHLTVNLIANSLHVPFGFRALWDPLFN